MKDSQKIIAQIPNKEMTKVKKFAEQEKRTLNSFTRKALADYVKKLEGEQNGK